MKITLTKREKTAIGAVGFMLLVFTGLPLGVALFWKSLMFFARLFGLMQ